MARKKEIPLFTLDICGLNVEVIYKKLDGSEGEYDYEDSTIYLHPEYSLIRQKYTLWHEILHVIRDMRLRESLNLGVKSGDAMVVEELIVDTFGCGVHDVLRQNERLRDWLYNDDLEGV